MNFGRNHGQRQQGSKEQGAEQQAGFFHDK